MCLKSEKCVLVSLHYRGIAQFSFPAVTIISKNLYLHVRVHVFQGKPLSNFRIYFNYSQWLDFFSSQ